MRATIHDATGPRLSRWLVPSLGLFVAVLGLAGLLGGVWPSGALLYAGLAVALAAPCFPGRFRPRVAEVTPLPGRLVVRGAGPLNQTIHASDVLAASSARTERGFCLVLERGGRDAPIELDFATEAEHKRALDAIGVGRRPFGSLTWSTRAVLLDRLRPVALLLPAALWALLALVCLFGKGLSMGVHSLILQIGLTYGITPAVIGLVTRGRRTDDQVRMSPEGLWIHTDQDGWRVVPYAAIAHVTHEAERWLVVRCVDGTTFRTRVELSTHGRRTVSREELAQAIAQIEAAAIRARDLPPLPEEGSAAALARRPGEPVRAWLERLDVTAHQGADGGGGYRGAGVVAADLWSVLEDHDAAVDLRSAAARVLMRGASDEERARIDAILSSVRDPDVRVRMRVAAEDPLNDAAEELEELEKGDARAMRRDPGAR